MASSTKTKSDKPKGKGKGEGKGKGDGGEERRRTSRAKDQPGKEGKKRDRRMNAKNADRFELYQRAVNSPETDIDFLEKAYAHYREGTPLRFREDFCGTASMCSEWVRRDPARSAEGVDLDPEPVEWGKRNNFNKVEDGIERVEFRLDDVRSASTEKPDITAAQNFSYWCFKTRKELVDYCKSVRENLADDGIFVMDLYGGPEATVEQEELRSLGGGIEYVWDQREYLPGTGQFLTAIHFRFRDGSELTNAFEYDWRFWHLGEIRDVLYDAGFKDVTTWFEGTDPDDEDEGDGIFEIDERGENCEAWLGYLVSAK